MIHPEQVVPEEDRSGTVSYGGGRGCFFGVSTKVRAGCARLAKGVLVGEIADDVCDHVSSLLTSPTANRRALTGGGVAYTVDLAKQCWQRVQRGANRNREAEGKKKSIAIDMQHCIKTVPAERERGGRKRGRRGWKGNRIARER